MLKQLVILVSLAVTGRSFVLPGMLNFRSNISAQLRKHFASPEPSIASTSDNSSKRNNNGYSTRKISVLVCPAQFCVPDDYKPLLDNLKTLEQEGKCWIGTFRVAPLPRTEWIKVARQLPTMAFFEGNLPVLETLGWYFDAIDQGIAEILAEEGANARICIIGHSIGGWVARAYLGGLGQSSTAVYRLAVDKVSSLVTIGTPHTSPEGALVDQTRGLLREIAQAPSCTPQALTARGIDITCVCSDALEGKLFSTNVEELVAVASYLPLVGKIDASGDGIVPIDLAFMDEPARRVIVQKCSYTNQLIRHAHIVPTPWNLWDGYAPSIKLPEETFPSYISPGVLSQWVQYIR